jgi:DNA-binding MarR family transcriptional regulator
MGKFTDFKGVILSLSNASMWVRNVAWTIKIFIDLIGTIEYPNVTKIANEMYMTRGAISKICKRLLKKGLVESYQRPDNNKEIYYRLTEEGRHIYNEHKKLHSQARQEKLSVINTYSEYEQSIILCFLNDINRLYNRKPAEKKYDQD